MGNQEDYNALLPQFGAIQDGAIRTPSQPVDSFAQEAENLAVWAEGDRSALEAAGLDWQTVTSIPARAGALRQAESDWLGKRFGQAEAQRAWKDAEEEGIALREDLLAAMRFAYRYSDELLGRVSIIAEGGSQADLIQDLNDIATLGRDNPDPLTSIGISTNQLDEAATKSDELAGLLAIREGDSTSDPAKKLRDQAYTYLEQAVNEVRSYGRYVMRKDDRRASGYTRQYRSRTRSSSSEQSPAGQAAA